MFGNKFYLGKLFGSLGLFVLLCVYGYMEGRWINPDPVRASVIEPGYDGKELWIPGTVIERLEKDGFVFRQKDREVLVHGKRDWMEEGMKVELTGTYHSNPPSLNLTRARPVRIFRWWWIILAGSLIVLGGVTLLFFRRFRVRREAWEVKWPTS